MSMNAGIAGIRGPERARDRRADVRRGHRLRRRVAGVPVILMPRVQDEPRSPAVYERISVARSITFAMFSRPCEILMLSTAVSIAGNVQSTRFGFEPFSNGVYAWVERLRAAMPPPIHSTMTVSAVAGETFSYASATEGSFARICFGYPAAKRRERRGRSSLQKIATTKTVRFHRFVSRL